MNSEPMDNQRRILLNLGAVISVIVFMVGATVYLMNRLASIEAATRLTNDRLDVMAKQLNQRRTQTFTVPMMRLWQREFSALNPGVKLPDLDSIIKVFPDE